MKKLLHCHFPASYEKLARAKLCLFPIQGVGNIIEKRGRVVNSRLSIIGNNNRIYIAKGCILRNVELHIRGDNHLIEFGENCKVYEWGSFWCEGHANVISIGKNTTIRSAHFCAQEQNTSIILGESCMLSNNLEIRTSDSHPYYTIGTVNRLNQAASVFIGNRVWICAKTSILKGVNVGDGSIIGYASVLSSKEIPQNSLVAGVPAKVIRTGVYWNPCF